MFEELIPDIQEPARALFLAAGQAGLHPRVTSTIRGRTEQARLYRRYLSGLAKYPVAPPGTSAHEFGYAFDMVCTPLDALADVGYTWTTWGGVWHSSDEVHFEYPGFQPPVTDELLAASAFASKSPVLSLLAPWQLQLYNAVPWIRGLINPLWTIDQLNAFFASL
jgi:hypothetical protein